MVVADELADTVTRIGRWTVFDPAPLLRRLTAATADTATGNVQMLDARRTA